MKTNNGDEINLNDFEEFMVPDFVPLGKPYTLTISGASIVKSYDRRTNTEIDVPALSFREHKKKLKLTSGDNRRTLGRLYGPRSGNWIGKVISVRVIEKKIFGEMKRFFTIDAIVPQTSKPATQSERTDQPLPDDEVLSIATAIAQGEGTSPDESGGK